MSGETNRLTELATTIQAQPAPREMDVLLSTGEQVTIALLSMALEERGCPARSYTGGQVRITTDKARSYQGPYQQDRYGSNEARPGQRARAGCGGLSGV